MANVAHASLTGSQLHEPKGVSTAALGEVYVANGSGSGSWSNVGTSSFTGMIADFAAPVAPTGWLELDGTVISTVTYSALYAVMAIQTSGTRTNGSPIITSIASTATFKAGYYVFGTGIASGTTIVTVDSPTQITLSNNASSSGTSAFAVSPWLLNTGTISLPDMTTAGRYRRSRAASTKVGDLQADIFKSHDHGAVSGAASADHTHGVNIVSGAMNSNQAHTHNELIPSFPGGASLASGAGFQATQASAATSSTNTDHTHNVNGTTSGMSVGHTHSIAADGGAETRPVSLVVLTCIKT